MKRMIVCRGRGGGEGRVKKEEERDDNRERDSWIKRERERVGSKTIQMLE